MADVALDPSGELDGLFRAAREGVRFGASEDEEGFEGPLALVVAGEGGLEAGALELVERLAESGCPAGALVPDAALIGAPELDDPAAQWELQRSIDDREAASRVLRGVSCLRAVAGDGAADRDLVLFGLGIGGTQAWLAACRAEGIDALCTFAARLVYPELERSKPVQPLELALNLEAPLFAQWGEDDAVTGNAEREALAQRLSQFARTFDIVTHAGAGHGYARWPDSVRRAALDASLAFLREVLEP